MMRIILLSILTIVLNNLFCVAQPTPKPAVNSKGKYAYVVTDYVYDNALPFNDYEAAVKQNGKWFFVDEDFKPTTPLADTIDFSFGYHDPDNYYSEIKLMKSGNKWFLYDTWRDWQSDSFLLLTKNFLPWNNVAVMGPYHKQFLLNIKNHKVSPIFDSLMVGPDEGWRKNIWAKSSSQIIRINNRTEKLEESFDFLVPLISNMYSFAFKQDGVWNIRAGKKDKIKKIPETDIYLFPEYGLFMVKKRESLYLNTGDWYDGLKKVKLTNNTLSLEEGDDPIGLWNTLLLSDSSRVLFKREKYGFMDMHLNVILQPQYDFAYEFLGRNHTAVQIGYKWSLLDRQGNIISKTTYKFLFPWGNGLYIAQKDSLYGIIDSNENIILPFDYNHIEKSIYGFTVKRNGKIGFIDKQGEELLPCIFSSLKDAGKGWLQYEKEGLKGLFDINTRAKFSEGNFNELRQIGNGYIYHIDAKKKELITSTGEILLSGNFADIINLNDGFFGIRTGHSDYYLGSKYTIYNANERKMIPGEYEYVSKYKEGIFAVSNGRRYGFIDKQGNVTIPFEFTYAGPFNDGKAKVQKWPIYFFIDHSGKKIKPK